MTEPGILAIWNDCRAGHEAEFEAWFQGEHLLERLAVPGFLFGRRHEAISGSNAYFNFYLTESPAVLTSKAYLERLDNPTPMTHTVMSEVFINMNRTVCHRTVRRGAFRGAASIPPMRVPRSHDYVMGDNRHPLASFDSRSFGPVPAGSILGRAVLVVWPLLRRTPEGRRWNVHAVAPPAPAPAIARGAGAH